LRNDARPRIPPISMRSPMLAAELAYRCPHQPLLFDDDIR
jgi:hypothetical protein